MFFQIYQDSSNYWRWRLKAANYKIVADSGEGYYNKSDCLAGINLVKSAWNAPVYDA
ncbi:MAG: DUF1508 domain-containing protein [Bacteroidetes bacterium]|nr:DUF1508 domain-containing protein [Bacteroidota bacterium]MCW5894845.1 DUF1508 domain-containing protein [Bacteroidota bacterium]